MRENGWAKCIDHACFDVKIFGFYPAKYTNDNQDIITVLKLVASFGLAEFIMRENSSIFKGASVEDISTKFRDYMNEIIIDL